MSTTVTGVATVVVAAVNGSVAMDTRGRRGNGFEEAIAHPVSEDRECIS